jgi:MSHA biogenesis protein MshL
MTRVALALALLVAACSSPPPRLTAVDPQIAGVIAKTAERAPESRPEAIQSAVLPPLRLDMPATEGLALEPRFDLAVSNAPASQVFMSIVSGTRYNMLVHPSVSGSISVTLKDVTVPEALSAIRDLYGFDYRIEGNRIFIQPTGLQTRVFQVNYLPGQRRGSTVLRVTSGSLVDSPATGGVIPSVATPGAAAGIGVGGAGAAGLQGRESSRVSTDQQATFWVDLCEALVAMVFPPEGTAQPVAVVAAAAPEDRQRSVCNRRHATSERSIVVTPHSGVIVVRATSMELRSVENYLRATRLAVERQVMLEAKIIEVTLSDAYQAGINWAILGKHLALGQLAAGEGNAASLATQGTIAVANQGAAGLTASTSNRSLTTAAGSFAGANPAGGVFGFALQTANFAALLTFLESQGAVQVLSSPRIATLNNQKAVLKVGFDELFVSNLSVSPPQLSGGTTTQATIAPQFSPYFQGIVLDVTPQIDENGMITLHVHPSISEITPVNRQLDLGTGGGGTTTIPTARSQVSETDTIVRVGDSNIVAIGGLMSVDVRDNRGGIPGVPDEGLGALLRNTDRRLVKKELVILLKPTIIHSERNWDDDLRETRERFGTMGTPAQETRRGTPRR